MCRIEELQSTIQYRFDNETLLVNALTHSSYASENGKNYRSNNERLEFIGDAYLGAVVATKLYSVMDDTQEGILSRKRAEVVCESTLADVARSIGLGKYILLGKGEDAHNGREKDSILSDAMEAVIGAIFLDGGFDACREVILRLFAEKIRMAIKGELIHDFKSELQRRIQHRFHENRLEYVVIAESGPAHDKTFTVEVRHRDEPIGEGSSKSKLKAEQAAAESVLKKGVF